jgi:hypothetical protein
MVTDLNDAVLAAPSMLMVSQVSWSSPDRNSFDLTLTDHGRMVAARVLVDSNGAPRDFSTTDRFFYDTAKPKQPLRTRCSTPAAGWNRLPRFGSMNGRPRSRAASF